MDFVIKEGMIEVGAVDQLDQRFSRSKIASIYSPNLNVDEMKKDIDKSE